MQGGKDICFNEEHPSNALSLIVLIEFGNETSDKEEQFLNVLKSMNATDEGIEIDFNDSQPSKQPDPIDVTEEGITIFFNLLQFLNAPSSNTCKYNGKTTTSKLEQ